MSDERLRRHPFALAQTENCEHANFKVGVINLATENLIGLTSQTYA